jgi:hypothetical protein
VNEKKLTDGSDTGGFKNVATTQMSKLHRKLPNNEIKNKKIIKFSQYSIKKSMSFTQISDIIK